MFMYWGFIKHCLLKENSKNIIRIIENWRSRLERCSSRLVVLCTLIWIRIGDDVRGFEQFCVNKRVNYCLATPKKVGDFVGRTLWGSNKHKHDEFISV